MPISYAAVKKINNFLHLKDIEDYKIIKQKYRFLSKALI